MPTGYKKDGTFAGKVFKKGHIPFYKGTKGVAKPNKTSFKKEQIREKCINWKGGRCKTKLGYIQIYSPKHPYANGRYVFEHRLVMEKHLGRYLTRKEVVHHINGNPSDNRIKNLMLFSNNGKHIKFHKLFTTQILEHRL